MRYNSINTYIAHVKAAFAATEIGFILLGIFLIICFRIICFNINYIVYIYDVLIVPVILIIFIIPRMDRDLNQFQ